MSSTQLTSLSMWAHMQSGVKPAWIALPLGRTVTGLFYRISQAEYPMFPLPCAIAAGASSITLRLYQEEASTAVLEAWIGPQHRALLSLSTKPGKTTVCSALASRCNVPALIVAHREECLLQARAQRLMVHLDADIGLGAGKPGFEAWGHLIPISEIQTIVKPRRLAMRAGDLASGGITIVDAGHQAQASTYRMLLETLQNVCLQGVIATSNCGDKTLEEDCNDPVYRVAVNADDSWGNENNAPPDEPPTGEMDREANFWATSDANFNDNSDIDLLFSEL
jgi:superfamily II DNA or RNA helicase